MTSSVTYAIREFTLLGCFLEKSIDFQRFLGRQAQTYKYLILAFILEKKINLTALRWPLKAAGYIKVNFTPVKSHLDVPTVHCHAIL